MAAGSSSITTREEVIALAALMGVTGVGILLIGLNRGPGGTIVPTQTWCQYIKSNPQITSGFVNYTQAVSFPSNGGTINLPHDGTLTIVNPQVLYQGPAEDAYTYAQIVQIVNGKPVTMFGSGVAGIALNPSNAPMSSPQLFPLIAPNQVQPGGQPPGPDLTLFPWPGPAYPGGICGAPPVTGSTGQLMVQIYGNFSETGLPQDDNTPAPGFTSPTCANRQWCKNYVWPGIITFT